ncbi:ABC transporter permease [Streptomyces sp. NPDC058045]|uniref:ABC transporter permease n=1 Tax=Streptomyces sp. NPDC058045 TaxID=3346311 RepID=UPI0036E5D867
MSLNKVRPETPGDVSGGDTGNSPPAGSPEPGRRRRRLDLSERPEFYLVPLVFIVTVGLWEIGVQVFDVPAFVLPRPSAIFSALLGNMTDALFWYNVRVTMTEALIGYAVGCGIAMALGVAISQFRLLEKSLMPYVVAFQAIPIVALAPLIVLWFGFDLTSKVVISALIAFFPLLVNVIEGLRASDPAQLEMLRSFGASRRQVFVKVRVPNALPFIFAGLDIAALLALTGAVVGEFVGAKYGLGYLVLQANYKFDIAEMFALLIVLSLMALLLHFIVKTAQKRVVFWASDDHHAR